MKCLLKMMDVGIGIMMDYHMEEILIQEGYIERVEVASESDAETLQNA